MEETRNQYPQYDGMQESEIDVMGLLKKFVKNWKTVAKWTGIAIVVGLVAGFSLVSTYTVKTVMAPEIAQKTGSSSLASLASLAGVNMNTMTVTDAMYPDLYPQIVSSVPFLVELFDMPVEFMHHKDTVNTTYYDYILHYSKAPWYKKVINAPFKLLALIMNKDKEKVQTPVDPFHLTKPQEKVFKVLSKRVQSNVDKKTYLITLTVTDQNPVIAAQLAETVIKNLERYVVSYRTEKSRDDLAYYEQLYNEAQEEYFAAQQRYARYVDANQGVVLQRVLIERERLQNETSLKYQLYNVCAQQVQQAKAKVQQERPVCAVIQPPTVPLRDNESGAKTLAIWTFLGFCLATVWVIWGKEWFPKFWKDLKSDEEAAPDKE